MPRHHFHRLICLECEPSSSWFLSAVSGSNMQSELDPFLTSAHSSAFSETIFPLWRMVCGFLRVPSSGKSSVPQPRDSGRGRRRLWGGCGWSPLGCSPGTAPRSRHPGAGGSVSAAACASCRQPAAGCWKPPSESSHRSSGNGGRLEPSTDQWMTREGKRGWLCAEQPPGDNDKARSSERCTQVRTINVQPFVCTGHPLLLGMFRAHEKRW